jgi:hypothetical protein
MTNGESEALIDEIVRSVAHAHGWPVAPRPAKRVATTLVPADYVALAGRYRIDLGDRTLDVVVTAGARRLSFIGASGRPAELLPESATQFFTPESGTEFTFVRGPGDTRATALRIDQAGQQFTARRLP